MGSLGTKGAHEGLLPDELWASECVFCLRSVAPMA